jgi:hypothetical protein
MNAKDWCRLLGIDNDPPESRNLSCLRFTIKLGVPKPTGTPFSWGRLRLAGSAFISVRALKLPVQCALKLCRTAAPRSHIP